MAKQNECEQQKDKRKRSLKLICTATYRASEGHNRGDGRKKKAGIAGSVRSLRDPVRYACTRRTSKLPLRLLVLLLLAVVLKR